MIAGLVKGLQCIANSHVSNAAIWTVDSITETHAIISRVQHSQYYATRVTKPVTYDTLKDQYDPIVDGKLVYWSDLPSEEGPKDVEAEVLEIRDLLAKANARLNKITGVEAD